MSGRRMMRIACLATALAALAPAVLVVASAFAAPGADPRARLDPGEIAAISPAGAGAGTSGVSGIQTRVLSGNPSGAGLYTIELTVPARTRIEAHIHPDDRVVSVISGTWYFGYGESHDDKAVKALPEGSYYTEPPGVPHFARTGEAPAVVRITGVGPTGTTYLGAGERGRTDLE